MKYDIDYIINYILSYDIGVPIIVVISISLFVCSIVAVLFCVKTDYPVFIRQASFCLLMGYIFLVLCTTILYREESFENRYNLYPLICYTVLYNKLLAQIIMNIMMFVPIGFFVGEA